MSDKLIELERPQLVLASASPRRAELLRAAGITFSIRIADVDETRLPHEAPATYVHRLSRDKALAIAGQTEAVELILGADTTVVVSGEVIGKPADADDAAGMLSQLSGRWHEVLTGVTLLAGNASSSEVVETRVKFTSLKPNEIRWYVESGEAFDKAGAYAIQGLAARFVERIEGSYSNVVGLPIETVYRLARGLGVEL